MNGRKGLKLLTVAVTAALVACGGGGDGTDGSDGAEAPTSSASACFNADLFRTGTRQHIERHVNGLTIAERTDTLGAALFGSSSATAFATEVLAAPAGVAVGAASRTTVYSERDGTSPRSRLLGSDSAAGRIAYDPPILVRFDLTEGASHTQAYLLVQANPQGAELYRARHVQQDTYVGREAAVTPAGRFVDACKFTRSYQIVQEPSGASSSLYVTEWIDAGSGVILRSQSGSDATSVQSVSEVVAVSIDGEAVTP